MVTNTNYYPISFLPVYTYNNNNVTFNPEYVNNLISLGVTDYFSPTQFASNPLFAQVDNYNQNIGILQTTTNALNNILTLINDFNNISSPGKDAVKTLSEEINSIINNSTFDGLNVFSQTLDINGQKLNLSIPKFDSNTSVEQYSELINNKLSAVNTALKNAALPFNTESDNNLNPFFNNDFSPFYDNFLLNTFNTETITPQTLQLLLS